MGTSSSWGGPTGDNPLLPPWADDLLPDDYGEPLGDADEPAGDGDDHQQEDGHPGESPRPAMPPPESAVSWGTVKGAMSRFARGTSSKGLAPVFRRYVGARHGPRTASHTAFSGRRVTQGFGGFLADIVRDGFAAAARAIGLGDLLGRDAEFVLATFVDLLAPDGALLEDAAARKALIETTFDLFERFNVEEEGMTALDGLDADGMREIVCMFVTNYVYERFLMELANCIERGSHSEQEANQLTEQGKDFVEGEVRCELGEVDLLTLDWRGKEGQRFVRSIYERAYSLLGA
jgi:hypothetical protein